jgi:hypothetical protein
MATPHKRSLITWSRNRGRNGWSVPTDVAEDMSAESMNVILERDTLGKKRKGSATQSITGTSFAGYNAIYRWVPGQSDTAAEVWIASDDSPTKILRVAAGSAASGQTLADNVATQAPQVRFCAHNGKLFIAYDSTVNRLHVWDGTSSVRRAGLALPAAATVGNTGSGSYAATLRYYRIQWLEKSGSTIVRQSNLGTAVSFTPSGSGTHAQITKPTSAGEGETHWRIWASADGDLYYFLADVVLATTTYDDNAVVADYDLQDPAPDEGANTPFPSVKYLLSTGDRLVGFGVWETSAGDSMLPLGGRVYFTPVLDASDTGDDERVSNTVDFKGWIDIARNSGGGEDRALAGPLDNNVFVFQSRGIYMLVPTGNASAPFRRITLTTTLGTISQECTFMGEDEAGRACIYFVDPLRGPYRYGASGFQYCGYDVQDRISQWNLGASSRVSAGIYDPELRAAIFGNATGVTNSIQEWLVFFVREGRPTVVEGVRGGWVRWAEASPSGVISMAMLPETIGASMSYTLKPYFGTGTVLRRWNDDSATQDGTTSYQAYVTSKAYDVREMFRLKKLVMTWLQAAATAATTITQTLIRNFTDETSRTATVSLAAAGSETRVTRKFEGSALTDIKQFQVQLGEAAAANTALWTLDEWMAEIEPMDNL